MENLAFRTRSLIIIHKGESIYLDSAGELHQHSDNFSSEKTQRYRELTERENTEKRPARRPLQESRYKMKI